MPSIASITADFASGVGPYVQGTAGKTGLANGKAFVAADSTYPALSTDALYSCASSSIFAEVGVGSAATAAYATIFELESPDGQSGVKVICDNGQVRYETYGGGGAPTVQIGAYNATSMKWWKLSFAANAATCTVSFSPDGLSWTAAGTYAVANGAGMTSVGSKLIAGSNGPTAVVNATLDSVNTAPTAPVVTPPSAGNGPVQLYVRNKSGSTPAQLVFGNAAGSRARLAGPTLWSIHDQITVLGGVVDAQDNDKDTVVATIKSTGANVVRLRVLISNYLDQNYESKASFLSDVVAWRDKLKANGIYTLVCGWDSLDGRLEDANWGANYYQAFPGFTDIANALKVGGVHDPYVLWEPFNEPNSISSDTWLTAMKATVSHFRNSVGYYGPLFVDTDVWSHEFRFDLMRTLMTHDSGLAGMSGKHQLVFCKHDYGDENSGWSGGSGADQRGFVATAWENNAGGLPDDVVFCESEFGTWNISGVRQLPWALQACDYFATQAFNKFPNFCGAMPFLLDWSDANSMLSGGIAYGNLNEWGKGVENRLFKSAQLTAPGSGTASGGQVGGTISVVATGVDQIGGVRATFSFSGAVSGTDIFSAVYDYDTNVFLAGAPQASTNTFINVVLPVVSGQVNRYKIVLSGSTGNFGTITSYVVWDDAAKTGTNSLVAPPPLTLAPGAALSTLREDFNALPSSAVWAISAGVTVENGDLRLDPGTYSTGAQEYLTTVGVYDFLNQRLIIGPVDALPDGATAQAEVRLLAEVNASATGVGQVDPTHVIRIIRHGEVVANTIACELFAGQSVDAGVPTTVVGSFVQSAATKWWALRESGGSVFFEYSADGSPGSWQVVNPAGTPITFPVRRVFVELQAGTY